MRSPVLGSLLSMMLLAACDGDDGPPSTATPQAAASPAPTQVVAQSPASSPAPSLTPAPLREVTGIFLEPRPTEPDRLVNLAPRPASPFQPWDRASVVVYDLETMTERNFGPALLPTISPDETLLALNLGELGPETVRILDLVSGELVHEFEWTGGLAGFTHDDYLFLAGGVGREQVYDLENENRVFIDELEDSELRIRLLARTQPGRLLDGSRYRLKRLPFDEDGGHAECREKDGEEAELCRAEAFEQWTLEEPVSGDVLLAFHAYEAAPAGAGELVIATSPRCEAVDGATRWCPEVLAELRADDPEGEFPYEEAQGTTNIFIVDIETGEAEFVATATFTPDTRVTPENWPLIANEDYVVWTESYCSLESPGHTRLYDRESGELIELDASLWVQFTATGDIGVDPFGPKAILDIETFEWNAVLPQEVIDVGESASGRYLYVGGVLGHGGLCG